MNSRRFGLMEAVDSQQRMSALFEFIEFWAGSRQVEYGEADSALLSQKLPAPLRELHAFAGRWPRMDSSDPSARLLAIQDSLCPLEELKVGANGAVHFLYENQAVWVCKTLAEGDDPPVWCAGDWDPVTSEPNWEPCCESLSKFLVSFVLQELVFGSPLSPDSEDFEAQFDLERSDPSLVVPVWLNGSYVAPASDEGHSVYLWRDSILVGHFCGSWFFGARDEAGARALEEILEQESKQIISHVTIYFGEKLILLLRPALPMEVISLSPLPFSIEAPPRAVDFDAVIRALDAVVVTEPLPLRRVQGKLWLCTGAESHFELNDERVARNLFVTCLQHSADPRARELLDMLNREWPVE